jgi:hypothetical protein
MSEFEDHLWREFVREHGDELAQMSRPAARHNRWARPVLLGGAGLGLAGAGTAVALVLGTATTPAAFAVTRNHDGTVTVSVASYSGIAAANAKLHQLGIRAKVMTQVQANCYPYTPVGAPARSHGIANAHWTINARNVPAGRTLELTPGGKVWNCSIPYSPAVPVPGTGSSGNS